MANIISDPQRLWPIFTAHWAATAGNRHWDSSSVSRKTMLQTTAHLLSKTFLNDGGKELVAMILLADGAIGQILLYHKLHHLAQQLVSRTDSVIPSLIQVQQYSKTCCHKLDLESTFFCFSWHQNIVYHPKRSDSHKQNRWSNDLEMRARLCGKAVASMCICRLSNWSSHRSNIFLALSEHKMFLFSTVCISCVLAYPYTCLWILSLIFLTSD